MMKLNSLLKRWGTLLANGGFAGNTFTVFWQIAAQKAEESHNWTSG
jgi:hypothetical protein